MELSSYEEYKAFFAQDLEDLTFEDVLTKAQEVVDYSITLTSIDESLLC